MLQPFRLTDPNGNRAEVAFDTLGFVAGSAVIGEGDRDDRATPLAGFAAEPQPGATAGVPGRSPVARPPRCWAQPRRASSTTWSVSSASSKPVCVSMLTRETHVSDALPAGGLKRAAEPELLRRVRAGDPEEDPGRARPGRRRWAGGRAPAGSGSGWTIFNNKGKPVKQVRAVLRRQPRIPLRSARGCQLHRSATTRSSGWSPRCIPITPGRRWCSTRGTKPTWDVNDTVLIDKPNDDPDVGGFFAGLGPVGVPAHVVRGARSPASSGPPSSRRRRRPPCTRPPLRSPTPTLSAGPSSPSPTTGSSEAGR